MSDIARFSDTDDSQNVDALSVDQNLQHSRTKNTVSKGQPTPNAIAHQRAKEKGEEAFVEPKWTQTTKFGLAVGAVVMLNAVTLGIEADHGEKHPILFTVIENAFCAIFTLELLAHFFVEGWRIYFSDSMNFLDFFLVSVSIIDGWIIRPLGVKVDLKMLSVLRMLRLVRLARLLKLVRAFKELTLIVQGLVSSLRTLFWSMFFLMILLYTFALFAVNMIGRAEDCPLAQPDCGVSMFTFTEEIGTQEYLFGSLDRTMLTLYICITDGCGQKIVQPTVTKAPYLCLYWFLFILLTTLGVLNLIAGCFCEGTVAHASANEQEMAKCMDEHRHHVVCRLQEILDDHSGKVSKELWLNALAEKPEVADYLIDLGLGEEAGIFEKLDAEGAGTVNDEEFFSGLMLLAEGLEPMRAKDIVPSLLSIQAASRRWRKVENAFGDVKLDLACVSGSEGDGAKWILPEAEPVDTLPEAEPAIFASERSNCSTQKASSGRLAEAESHSKLHSETNPELPYLVRNLNALTEKVNNQLCSLDMRLQGLEVKIGSNEDVYNPLPSLPKEDRLQPQAVPRLPLHKVPTAATGGVALPAPMMTKGGSHQHSREEKRARREALKEVLSNSRAEKDAHQSLKVQSSKDKDLNRYFLQRALEPVHEVT